MSSIGSWAELISSQQGLPEEFINIFTSFLTDKSYFPYTVYAPPDTWGFNKKTNAKLIFISGNKIIFFEKTKNEVITKEIDFKNVSYIEHGGLLLYSWIKIVGTVNDNIIPIEITFNSVRRNLFEHIIKTLRVSINNIIDTKNDELSNIEKQKFNYLSNINFKYMNYSRESIIQGEKVYNMLYQPLVKRKYFNIFSKIKIFPYILILTETELIIIRDEESQIRAKFGNHGGIWNYLPLNRIINLKSKFDTKTTYTDITILYPGGSLNLKFYGIETELEIFINDFFKRKQFLYSSS